MKVYIAGKITGLDNFKEVFAEAEETLKALGHNPMSFQKDLNTKSI